MKSIQIKVDERKKEWFDTYAICYLLDVSPDWLRDRVDNGSFELGVHYLLKNPEAVIDRSMRREFRWSYDNIVEYMAGRMLIQ